MGKAYAYKHSCKGHGGESTGLAYARKTCDLSSLGSTVQGNVRKVPPVGQRV